MTQPVAFAKTGAVRFSKRGPHGVYIAYGAFSKRDGAEFDDSQGDHLPDDELFGAALSLAQSRTVKVEHAGDARGSAPLIMPLTDDVKAGLELTGPHSGLAVGLQPDDALAAMIDSGEIAELSIAGVAEVEMVTAAVAKSDDGTEPIAKGRKRVLRKVRIDEISLVKRGAHGAGTRIAIAKRAPDEAPTTTATGPENDTMTDLEKTQAADLATARAELAKSRASLAAALALPPDQATFAKALAPDAVDGFLARPAGERATLATPIYKSATTGESYFAGDNRVELAKALDAQGVELAKARESGETAEIAKSAAAVPCIKSAALIVKAIRGHKLTADEQTEAMAQLATSNASIAMVTKAVGYGGGSDATDPASPQAELDAIAAGIANAKGVSIAKAADLALDTPRGAQLYKQIEGARRAPATA